MCVAVIGGIRPNAVRGQRAPVYVAVALAIHLRRADSLNAGLRSTDPFAAVGQGDIQLIGAVPAVGGRVIDTVFGGIGCRIAVRVEVVVEGA